MYTRFCVTYDALIYRIDRSIVNFPVSRDRFRTIYLSIYLPSLFFTSFVYGARCEHNALFNGLTEDQRSPRLATRSYGIIIRSFIIPRFISETLFNTFGCISVEGWKIAGNWRIIQRRGGSGTMDAVVRCLQRNCCGRGEGRGEEKRPRFAGKFSRETRLCKLAPRVNSRVSLYNNRPPQRDGCYMSSINVLRALCAHLVCFASSCANTKLGQHR